MQIHLSDLPNPQVRFNSICEVRDKQQSQPLGSVQRCNAICGQIPNQLGENQGYHRECYHIFTSKLNCLKTPSTAATDERQSLKHGRHSSSDKILFEQNCIFCKGSGRKKFLDKGSWTSEGLSYFSHGGGPAILAIADQRGDEELATGIRDIIFLLVRPITTSTAHEIC